MGEMREVEEEGYVVKEPGGDGRHCWWMCELGGEGVRAGGGLYIGAEPVHLSPWKPDTAHTHTQHYGFKLV